MPVRSPPQCYLILSSFGKALGFIAKISLLPILHSASQSICPRELNLPHRIPLESPMQRKPSRKPDVWLVGRKRAGLERIDLLEAFISRRILVLLVCLSPRRACDLMSHGHTATAAWALPLARRHITTISFPRCPQGEMEGSAGALRLPHIDMSIEF